MNKAYSRIVWENSPSAKTPLNETNMNLMDAGINELDNRIITLDTTKATKLEISTLFSDLLWDENTGVLTLIRLNGSSIRIDTKLEKLAINFAYDVENERLVITLADGTVQYVDLKALITQYDFVDSDTITLTLSADGKVQASIKAGSITGEHLRPDYLADIVVQAESATASANSARLSANAAATSESNAQTSATSAATSASESAESASAAAISEANAKSSEEAASQSHLSALSSADSARMYSESAQASSADASNSESVAKQSADNASTSASLAKSYSDSASTSASDAEAQANQAKSEADRAKAEADRAESVSSVNIATTEIVGIVKPDGTTITIDTDGTIHGNASVTVDNALSTDSTNPIANKAVAEAMENVDAKTVGGKHASDFANADHSHTKSDIGLGNVPNVATNDQTPTYTVASSDAELTSGEKLSVAFGKIAKAIKSFIAHLADTTSHITSTERTTWNSKANASHGNHVPTTQTASNKVFLRNDNTWQTVTPANIGAAPTTHNHTKSQITDFPTSLPASDVPAWAKASAKPTYTWSEITSKPTSFTPASHNQAASTITAGTLAGQVNANASAMATLTNAQLRDAVILDSDPGEGATVSYNPGTIVWTK